MRGFLALLILLFAFFFLTSLALAQGIEKRTVLPKNETVNHDYFAGNEEVQLSGTVNGDAYVGGGTVIVDGTIDGDLIVGGGSVTISASVRGDVRVGGGSVTITGANILGNVTAGGGQITIDKSTVIQGSLVAGGGDLKVLAPLGRGATIGGGTVLISNFVGGDVLAGAGKLTLSPDAKINGNLTYWSENKAGISEGATVSGSIKQEIPPREARGTEEARRGILKTMGGLFLFFKLVDIISIFVVGLIMIFLFPIYMNNAANIVKTRFWSSLLWGFIWLILMPVIAIVFMITVFGIPIGITIFLLYFLLIWFARIFSIAALGQIISAKMKNKGGAVLAFAIGLLAYVVLQLIPVINVFATIAVVLSGFGAWFMVKKEYYTKLRRAKQI